MGDFICDGTEFSCPFCTNSLKLSVPSSVGQGETKSIANLTNSSFPPPGGQCLITKSSCTPNVQVADPGQSIVQINNQTALGANCKFSCCQGGTLTVSNKGQGTAQHVKTSRSQASPKPLKCTDARKNILDDARALAKSAKTIYYTQDNPYRRGKTPKGHSALVQYHKPHVHHHHTIKIDGEITSFDCSGFVSQVFINIGKPLSDYGASDDYPIVSRIDSLDVFTQISLAQAKPGDLVVWLGKKSNHIGVYEGNGKFLSAMLNVTTEDGYRTSVRSISIKSFGEPYSHFLRFTDCIEE